MGYRKRRVHDMNWFYKHCELNQHNNYINSKVDTSSIYWTNTFFNRMFQYAGTEVYYDYQCNSIREEEILEDGNYWDGWMFEPIKRRKKRGKNGKSTKKKST